MLVGFLSVALERVQGSRTFVGVGSAHWRMIPLIFAAALAARECPAEENVNSRLEFFADSIF
jgi:hypothetical protein